MRRVLAVSFFVLAINCFTSRAIAEDVYDIAWSQQLGSSSLDISHAVAVDAWGNTYISGFTQGRLGENNMGDGDAFLAKYNPAGTLLWTEQLGTSEWDLSSSVAVDSFGNAYISGFTFGTLDDTNGRLGNAFLAKYDPAGNLLWTDQSSSLDTSNSVAADGFGNVYISGMTNAAVDRHDQDAFLVKYDNTGNLIWTEQLGTK